MAGLSESKALLAHCCYPTAPTAAPKPTQFYLRATEKESRVDGHKHSEYAKGAQGLHAVGSALEPLHLPLHAPSQHGSSKSTRPAICSKATSTATEAGERLAAVSENLVVA